MLSWLVANWVPAQQPAHAGSPGIVGLQDQEFGVCRVHRCCDLVKVPARTSGRQPDKQRQPKQQPQKLATTPFGDTGLNIADLFRAPFSGVQVVLGLSDCGCGGNHGQRAGRGRTIWLVLVFGDVDHQSQGRRLAERINSARLQHLRGLEIG